jgi:hypothetical protein
MKGGRINRENVYTFSLLILTPLWAEPLILDTPVQKLVVDLLLYTFSLLIPPPPEPLILDTPVSKLVVDLVLYIFSLLIPPPPPSRTTHFRYLS